MLIFVAATGLCGNSADCYFAVPSGTSDPMRRILSLSDISDGLDELCMMDPRLARVRASAGEVPLRLSEPGFQSLVSIIVSQQVSRASADAIFARLTRLVDPLTPQALLAAAPEVFRQAGLSRPKISTLLAVSDAVADGLDLFHLCDLDARDAIDRMTAIPGIGPWTAECYLLFSAGHPDIFPARDVALQSSVGHAFGLETRPGEKALIKIAESWTPWRGVASRLFWSYYRAWKGREAVPAG
jgi:DNA-3-methyladenine glycosylase II